MQNGNDDFTWNSIDDCSTPPSAVFQSSPEMNLFSEVNIDDSLLRTEYLSNLQSQESFPINGNQALMMQGNANSLQEPQNQTVAADQSGLFDQSIIVRPTLEASLTKWPGVLNFKAWVQTPTNSRKKYCISPYSNKLFIGKNITFPIQISVNQWVNAEVVIRPVYVSPGHRNRAVVRCPNCANNDPNPEIKKHVVQADGGNPQYFSQGEQKLVALPLGWPAPGEDHVTCYINLGCRTSCVGGPNRRAFSLSISLIFEKQEVGRQVIDVKVCESAERDMKTEDNNRPKLDMLTSTMIKVEDISKQLNPPKKQKIMEDYINVRIPSKHLKAVKKYVKFLQYQEQAKDTSSDDSEH